MAGRGGENYMDKNFREWDEKKRAEDAEILAGWEARKNFCGNIFDPCAAYRMGWIDRGATPRPLWETVSGKGEEGGGGDDGRCRNKGAGFKSP